MIPKVIHYCWFGKQPMPELVQNCVKSWEKYCPDYQIKLWNEDNIDVSGNRFMKEAYDAKKWAFVADVARLQIIYSEGGVYLDTDVELIKSLDPLLAHPAFFGMEDSGCVAMGLGFGAEKNNPLIKSFLDYYNDKRFLKFNGRFNKTPSPMIQTKIMQDMGFVKEDKLQFFKGAAIYPPEYFCPKSYTTGVCNITDNTYSIHHYDSSWKSSKEKKRAQDKRLIVEKYGKHKGKLVWRFIRIKEQIKNIW